MSLCNKSINQSIGMNPGGYGSTMWITDEALGHYHEENSSMQCTFFQPRKVWRRKRQQSSHGGHKNSLIVRKPQILCNMYREFRIASIVSCKSYEYFATGQNKTQAFRTVSLTLSEKNGWSGEKDCMTSIHLQKHKRMEKFPTQYFSSSE